MVVALIAMAAVLLVLTALLAAPVSLAIQMERTAVLRMHWRLRWLFGLVDVGSSSRRRLRPDSTEPATGARLRRKRRRRGPGPRAVLATLRTPGFVRRAVRLLNGLSHRIQCECFYLRAEFGFDNPADTGQVYGALVPLLVAADRIGFDVHCRPNFLQPCLAGSLGATFRVRPISLVASAVGFLLSPPALRAIVSVWRARR